MSSPVTPGPSAGVAVQKKKSSGDSTGWRSRTKTVVSRTSMVFNSPELSDVKFIFKTKEGTDGTIIYGHKLILALASPVFDKMFFNQNSDLLTPVGDTVEMKDHAFTAAAFLNFLKFLYKDKINFKTSKGLSMELIIGLLHCTDYYDVPYLKKDCVRKLTKIMTRTNVIQILEVSILFRENDLTHNALAFLNRNLKFVLESDQILTLKWTTLFVIISRDSLDLDECFVLNLALKWAEHECKRTSLDPTAENKRKVLGPVFFEIRFALLTSDKISELVASNFLTLKESLDIFLAVHNGGNLTRTSTTPDGSKFKRSAPEVTFKSNPRIFGQRMELMESRKMKEKYKEEVKLDYWKSLAKVEADLLMEGIPTNMTEVKVRRQIQVAGFDTHLSVSKLRGEVGKFHVKFFYNPSKYKSADLLDPGTFDFDDDSIQIKNWVALTIEN